MTNWVTAQWLHQLHLAGVIKSNLRGEGGHGLPADKHPEEGRTPGLTAAENSEPAANRDETADNPERGMLYLKMKKKKKVGRTAFFTNVSVIKDKDRLWKCSRSREAEETCGNPLQYSCLENSMDRKAWQATVHGLRHDWAHTHTDMTTKCDMCSQTGSSGGRKTCDIGHPRSAVQKHRDS